MNSSTLLPFDPAELGSFIRVWMRNPLSMGAVAPSGPALARLMTRDIYSGARVVELGPGTGTFTRSIIQRGVDEQDLYLVERGAGFIPALEREFPGATVIEADATRPEPQLHALAGTVDFVISGLPLVLFSTAQKDALLERSVELMTDTGALYQFTYGGRCPIGARMLKRHRLTATRAGVATINMPPAFVYRIARSGVDRDRTQQS